MNIRVLVAGLGVVLLAGTVLAQDNNPNSPAYHALHNRQSPNYVGPGGQQQPAKPTGYWEYTWGSVATDDAKGVLGTSVGAKSEDRARYLAEADCKAKGGIKCRINLAYFNQCAVVITGDNGHNTSRAASIEEATTIGINSCKNKRGDVNCRVYYSACTEPVFNRY